ncbi:MAG: L-serine ammonia-lyase, iron-sulfur-dependent, subunit alpha [Oscillospiraceae bacterium]
MAFCSIEAMIARAGDGPLWEAVLLDDCRDRGASRGESLERMGTLWAAMGDVMARYDGERRSPSGLVGGGGQRMETLADPLCGDFLREVMAGALKTGECNACMGRIVAAPTAGASGVLPGVLLPVQKRYGFSDEVMIQALYVAAGFGQVIASRASISGAEGGCQAEIGSAGGMAAAALVFLRGGTGAEMSAACATALQNLMGLVCDPVAGLVEVPCVGRNVIGALAALSAADLALCGAGSPIPCDEVIDAMRAVGEALPASLRETGKGGLAATPTGRRIAAQLEKSQQLKKS